MATQGPPPAQEALPNLPAWLQALYEHIRTDPMGGMGVLLGSGAPSIRQASPKLGAFLHKQAQEILAEMHPNEQALRTSIEDLGVPTIHGALFGETIHTPGAPMYIGLTRDDPMAALTAIHEGVHGAYYLKNGTAFPPERYLQALQSFFKQKYPDMKVLGHPAEHVVEGMSRNIQQARP